MPKAYVLSNGAMHVGFDEYGQIYDLYFPYVGLENQMGRLYVHKVGIFVDGTISWLDTNAWNTTHVLDSEYNTGVTTAKNSEKQISLKFKDVVYNEKNILIRNFTITNHSQHRREVKIYFNQQFELYESFRGDTAYFDPDRNVIIHYKGRRAFLINAVKDETFEQFSEYSIGLLGIEGKEGTYRDAEDGQLSKNPIEHGLVDSVISLSFTLEPDSSVSGYFWLAAGKLLNEIQELNEYVFEKTPKYLMNTAQNYWRAWINKQRFSFYGLDEDIIRLFKQSLFVLRAHVDNNGAIIASTDSDLLKYGRDTYAYMWPRDGAFAAIALDNAGYHNITKTFFQFCNAIIDQQGFFMHKYRADQSLGSSWHPWVRDGKKALPIQEDETALVLWALWHHYTKTADIEFIETVYNSLIKKAALFLCSYMDQDLGLPAPSYDLWEEKYGTHTFTASAVFGALTAASKFAEILGKHESRDMFLEHANKIATGITNQLFCKEQNHFCKSVKKVNEVITKDTTIDASTFYALLHFNVLKHDNEMIQSTLGAVEEHLTVKKGKGGIARYQNDNYYRVDPETPGNPWVITTLWVAQYYIQKAHSLEDLEPVHTYLKCVVSCATPSGMIPEQINPITGKPISATPLSWSHAEFVSTVIYYLQKIEALGISPLCYPVE